MLTVGASILLMGAGLSLRIARNLFEAKQVVRSRAGGIAMSAGQVARLAAVCGEQLARQSPWAHAIPEMKKKNYNMSLATAPWLPGTWALIPPSVGFIF